METKKVFLEGAQYGAPSTEQLLHMQRHIVALEAEVEALKASAKTVPPGARGATAGYGGSQLTVVLPADVVRSIYMDALTRERHRDVDEALKRKVVEHFLHKQFWNIAPHISLEREPSTTDPLGGFDITARLIVGTPK